MISGRGWWSETGLTQVCEVCVQLFATVCTVLCVYTGVLCCVCCVCHCVLCCVCHSTAYSCGGPWISWNTTPPTHDQLCPSDHHHHALHEFDKYDQGAGLVWELFVFLGVTSVLLMTQPILKDWSPSPSIHISFSLKHFLFAAKRWMLALSVTQRQP